MSDGTSSAGGTESKADDKSTSALGGTTPDPSKNGAAGTQTPAGTGTANAAGADGKGAGTGTEGAGGEKPPEAFDFTKWEPKLPEGSKIEKGTLDAYRNVFKDLGLKGEGAQKLVDAWATAAKADVEAQLKQVEDNRSKGWEKLRADKDLGGQNFDGSIKAARRAVRELGGSELADRLFALGLDNDEVLVRAFVKAGRKMGEDSVGDTAHKPNAEPADSFESRVARTYSKSNSKES